MHPRPHPTVRELVEMFLTHALTYYRKPSGRLTGEHVNYAHALAPLLDLFGPEPASAMTPGRLKAVRQRMIESGRLSRGTINQRIGKVRRLFRWAVSEELVEPAVLVGLQAVEGLKLGRCRAPEGRGVRGVEEERAWAIMPYLPASVAALLEILLYTGMRVSEARIMRVGDIATGRVPWEYRPREHKCEHHGKERLVMLGPRAIEVLRPRMKYAGYLFSPCGGVRPYRRDSIYNAIQRACRRAGVEPFCPLAIRHTFATKVRRGMNIEASRVMLGHTSAATTEIYAEMDQQLSRKTAMEFG